MRKTLDRSEASGAGKTLTIGELRQADMRLAIDCHHCHRFRYLKDNRFAETENVSEIAKKLKCARCGSPEVETIAVSRDPQTGYWPAERS